MKTAALLLILTLGQTKEKTPYLDQTKVLLPQQEWNREIVGKTFPGGKFYYRIDSAGPIGLTILSDAGYKKLLRMAKGEKLIFHTGDVLMSKDFKGPTTQAWTPTLKPGSHWFMIMNGTKQPAQIRLRSWREQQKQF